MHSDHDRRMIIATRFSMPRKEQLTAMVKDFFARKGVSNSILL